MVLLYYELPDHIAQHAINCHAQMMQHEKIYHITFLSRLMDHTLYVCWFILLKIW